MALTIDAKVGYRIDSASNWLTTDPVLLNGEGAVSTEIVGGVTYYTLKIGNGVDQWSEIIDNASFVSKLYLEQYIENYFNSNYKNKDIVINPYNSGVSDANANFTCLNQTNNTAELNAFIATLPTDATIVFSKGIYNINSTLAIGARKIYFDYGAIITCNYNSSYTSGETPFISLTSGEIKGGNFLYSGTGSIYQPCISATSSVAKIRDCYLNNFMKVISGTGYIENNIFEHATEVINCAVTSGAVVKGNFFKSSGNLGIINSSGSNRIIYNNVGTINLVENSNSISAFNVVANATSSVVGNKVNDFNIGV